MKLIENIEIQNVSKKWPFTIHFWIILDDQWLKKGHQIYILSEILKSKFKLKENRQTDSNNTQENYHEKKNSKKSARDRNFKQFM